MDADEVERLTVALMKALTANSANGSAAIQFLPTERGFEFFLHVESVEMVDITPRPVYTMGRVLSNKE